MLLSEELGLGHYRDRCIANSVELKDCLVVYDDYARRDGSAVKWTFWGREREIKFDCKFDVRIKSYLVEAVNSYREPKIVHVIKINSTQPIEIVLVDYKEHSIIGFEIEAVRLSGRLKALSDSVGIYDASPETLEICRNLGQALGRVEKVGEIEILTNIGFIDNSVICVKHMCPACGGEAIYRYRHKNVKFNDRECSECGWRGYIELHNGRGVVTRIPLTTNVRNLLNSLELADAEDVYERLFEVGMSPTKLIAKATILAKGDIKEARNVRAS